MLPMRKRFDFMLRRRQTVSALFAVLLVGAAWDILAARSTSDDDTGDVSDTPLGAIRVSLVPDQTEIMVGEPVYLSFTVRNLTWSSMRTIQGGDYRNKFGRPESYSVGAINERG